MKALRYYGQRDIRQEELPLPTPKNDEVLIRVTDVGLYQTQINEFIGGPFVINKDPHPLTKKAIPLIPGHELGGIRESVGKNVDKKFLNKQVSVLPLIYCGICPSCKNKKENLCDTFAHYGLLGEDGGMEDARFQTVSSSKLKLALYDVVIDCAGSDSYNQKTAFTESFQYLKKGGSFLGLGTYFSPLEINPAQLLLHEYNLIWSFSYTSADFASFTTPISLDNIIEDGYLRAKVDKDSFTRLVVQC